MNKNPVYIDEKVIFKFPNTLLPFLIAYERLCGLVAEFYQGGNILYEFLPTLVRFPGLAMYEIITEAARTRKHLM